MNQSSNQTASQTQDGPARGGSRFAADELDPKQDLVEYLTEYARQHPGATALWCLGIGFVLGWKLKPW